MKNSEIVRGQLGISNGMFVLGPPYIKNIGGGIYNHYVSTVCFKPTRHDLASVLTTRTNRCRTQ
jgi:hypothetical protein